MDFASALQDQILGTTLSMKAKSFNPCCPEGVTIPEREIRESTSSEVG
jgi:hypothetical protein